MNTLTQAEIKKARQNIALAILIVGRNEMAAGLGIDGSNVSRWKTGAQLIPPFHCKGVEALVKKHGIGEQKTQVTAETLRPDYEFRKTGPRKRKQEQTS